MDKVLAILIGWPVAFLIFKYRWQIRQFTGDIDFAEKYLGAGGTNNLIIILGLLTFIGSLMYAAGTLQDLISGSLYEFTSIGSSPKNALTYFG